MYVANLGRKGETVGIDRTYNTGSQLDGRARGTQGASTAAPTMSPTMSDVRGERLREERVERYPLWVGGVLLFFL